MKEKINIDDLPEDVIEDLEEIATEIQKETTRKTSKKYKLPSSRDLAETVIEAALQARGIDPNEFPDLVIQLLEEKGYYTKYVTPKRIWRTYETLVRKRVIPDTLGVVIW